MPEPFADTLATVAAERTALVTRLQTLAARLELLPLDVAAEVLVLLEPAVAAFEQHLASDVFVKGTAVGPETRLRELAMILFTTP